MKLSSSHASAHKTDADAQTTATSLSWTKQAVSTPISRRGANFALMSLVLDVAVTLFILLVTNIITMQQVFVTTNLSLLSFLALVIVTRLTTLYVFDLYDTSQKFTFMSEARAVTVATALSIFVLLGSLYLTKTALPNIWIGVFFTGSVMALVSWRFGAYIWSYHSIFHMALHPRYVLMVGITDFGRELADLAKRTPIQTTKVVGFMATQANAVGNFVGDVPIVADIESDLPKIIRDYAIDEIILANRSWSYSDENRQLIQKLQHMPVPVRWIPNYMNLGLYSSAVASLDDLPFTYLREQPMTHRQRLLKRGFDIAVSSAALLLVLPVFLLVMLLIWLEDRQTPFFKQERVGENGKIFHMLKFRSMVVDADKFVDQIKILGDDNKPIYKRRDDPRITRIGKFIRATSLDELPQLLNILRGEMSIVGPRPEVLKIVENEYEPWQYERLRVPQGLTGWWQVNGRSEKECFRSTQDDIYYIEHYSFWLDVKIILMTIPALLKGKGAF